MGEPTVLAPPLDELWEFRGLCELLAAAATASGAVGELCELNELNELGA